MINLQHTKYADMPLSTELNDSKNLIQSDNGLQVPPVLKPIEINCNFDDTDPPEPVRLLNSTSNDINNQNTLDNPETDVQNEKSPLCLQSIPKDFNQPTFLDNSSNRDRSRNLNRPSNFQESLALHITVDEDNDSLHSWRPNLSISSLCSDFFMPSPTVENLQVNNEQMSNLAFDHNLSAIQMNPDGFQHGSLQHQPSEAFYGYLPQGENTYGINYGNYLNLQKSRMNAVRYEVINAKIELSDVKESVEKMQNELKEKGESKSVQDIQKLNEEIAELELECQCLCSEVYYYSKGEVLLGEIDENCYSGKKSCSTEKSDNPVQDCCQHSQNYCNGDVDEANKWQCPKCTFDNHPAINACEMCHLQRPTAGRKPPYLRTPPDECYCHPKKGTLSIQS